MTVGVMLVLFFITSSQVVDNNMVDNVKVTPKIEIVEIPSKLSVFKQIGLSIDMSTFSVSTSWQPKKHLKTNSSMQPEYWHNTLITTKMVFLITY